MKPEAYATLSAAPFVPPANPGQNPNIPIGSSGLQIAEYRRAHKEVLEEFNKSIAADKALKSLLITTLDEPCIIANRHKCVGHANVTTKELLAHLYGSYAKITSTDLRKNEARMNQQHNPNQPIEVLFDQIDDAIDYAAAGNTPFTNKQIVSTACNLVFDTGMHSDECEAWRKLPVANKT